jgi:hypothetical protein
MKERGQSQCIQCIRIINLQPQQFSSNYTLLPTVATSIPNSISNARISALILLQIRPRNIWQLGSPNIIRLPSESYTIGKYRLPNLNNVVLSSRTHDPRIGRIPRNITHAIRMSTMHKQQFRWPILRILGSLLNPNPREIPNNDPTIIPRRRKNRFLMR